MNPEQPAQNHPQEVATQRELSGIDERVLAQKEADLRDLFRSSKNPLDIITRELDTQEMRAVVDGSIIDEVKNRLQTISFNNEDDFVAQVRDAALPLWEITQRGKTDAYKQEGREMYTTEDVAQITQLITEGKAQKIFVSGNVGSGKTTFSQEISRALGYKNIDLDRYFQIFRQETGQETSDLRVLLNFVLQKEKPPFVINHADLFRQGLVQNADMVIFLNPKKEELLKSRELRQENGAEGEWQSVNEDDYDKIAEQNLADFEKLGGTVVYQNEKSGTIARQLSQGDKDGV